MRLPAGDVRTMYTAMSAQIAADMATDIGVRLTSPVPCRSFSAGRWQFAH